jgi:hypothetical protein
LIATHSGALASENEGGCVMGCKIPDLVSPSALNEAKAKIHHQRVKVLAMDMANPRRDQEVRILGIMLANAASLETVRSLHFDLGSDTDASPSNATDAI